MAIQMRRGNDADFNPDLLQPGELAVSQDLKRVYCCFTKGIVIQLAVSDRLNEILEEMEEALSKLDTAIKQASTYATTSQSYAKGGTDSREGEDKDNAEYFKEQAELALSDTKEYYDKVKEVLDGITPAFELSYNTGHLSYALGTT